VTSPADRLSVTGHGVLALGVVARLVAGRAALGGVAS